MTDAKIRMYKITADYRSDNPSKPCYYVYGRNKKEAKERFSGLISWLKIYDVEHVDEAVAEKVVSEPAKYILI